MVQRAVNEHERRRAEALAACERRVTECAARLAELEDYQKSYARDFAARASAGIGGAGLRDYQTFLARLSEAVRQQTQLLSRAQSERDAALRMWQSAAQRAEAVGHMVRRWQAEERILSERIEQRETDERAQRIASGGAA